MGAVTPQEKADSIARDINSPRLVSATPVDFGDRFIFVFDIIPHETLPWAKGVEIEAVTASRDSVLIVLNDWKARVLHDINNNRPSPVVQKAIQVHGMKAVRKALG